MEQLDNFISDIHGELTSLGIKQNEQGNDSKINTNQLILELSALDRFNDEHIVLLDKLLFKVEVSSKIYDEYTKEWKKTPQARDLSLPLRSLLLMTFLKWYLQIKEIASSNLSKRCKLLNCIFKIARQVDLAKDSERETLKFLDGEIKAMVSAGIESMPESNKDGQNLQLKGKTLPITVLFSEGPIGRAYLETMRSLGVRPRKIIHMVSSRDLVNKKEIGRWLPRNLREKYAAFKQSGQIHYWPRHISRAYPEIKEEMFSRVSEKLDFQFATLKRACELKGLSEYCDTVEINLVSGLRDPRLVGVIKNCGSPSVLYTGGGIVPEVLLNIQGIRFIHIHPGYLPDVRGADGVLWSHLLKERAAATCFYMSPGIDTGDIVSANWLPKLGFNLDRLKYDLKTIYRSTYSFYDPWVRSFVLRKVLLKYKNLHDMPSVSQTVESGETYHFMQKEIQDLSFSKIFSEDLQDK